jgi:hypothetical protein
MYVKKLNKMKTGPKPSEASNRKMFFLRVSDKLHADLIKMDKDVIRQVLELLADKKIMLTVKDLC